MTDTRVERLRELKATQVLSYEQLAREIGVSFMSVYRWLKQGALPRNRLVIKAIDQFLARNGGGQTASATRPRRRKQPSGALESKATKAVG